MEVNNQAHLEFIKSHTSIETGQHKIKCPSCYHNRKPQNRNDLPLSVKIESDKIIYNCFNCDESGIISLEIRPVMKTTTPTRTTKIEKPENIMDGETAQWLRDRKIDPELARQAGSLLNINNNTPVIGFQYGNGKEVEGIKWRTANGAKKFWWEGSSQRLWGKPDKPNGLPVIEDTIVLSEGEMDTLAIKTAFKGKFHIDCYSVPNGAPNKIKDNKVDPSEDGRFKYIWEEKAKFEGIKRIILATDADHAGDVLADELARRLNKARCYRVDYDGLKDANDFLIAFGEKKLRDIIINAEPFPLHGINNLDYYSEEFQTLYEKGRSKGVSTGFESVDELFTLKTGQLVTVTGMPNDGKSAFLNHVVVNVAKNHGWKTCFCSFEKPPVLHSAELSQLLINKPFFKNAVKKRMSQKEKDFAETWINEHILFQDYISSGMPTIQQVLDKASSAVMRHGIRILIIDPFNFLVSSDNKAFDHSGISDMLSQTQLWAKQFDCLVFFVAHPAKNFTEYNGKKRVPDGVSVSGSMAWFAKSDIGITLFRPNTMDGDNSVELHCWKVRWGWQGKCGTVDLSFDTLTGRYGEIQEQEDDYKWAEF